jgi:hypothetical protein
MVALTQFCEGCAIRKHHKASYKLDITKERYQVPDLFSMGTFVAYAKGFTWWSILLFLFKDDYLSYKFVYCIKNKFEALSCFKHLVMSLLQNVS